jgi:hypothetical protein
MPPPQNPVVPGGPAAALFPTNNLKAGDVVNVTGPFQGLTQGMVRVKFNGAPWMAPAMRGPFSASVIVPDGAETGECMIEINGRVVFGRQCSVVQERFRGAKPQEQRDTPSWKNFGDKSRMGSYINTTESRGVGAVAALDRGGAGAGEATLSRTSKPSVVMRRRAESTAKSILQVRRGGKLLRPPKNRKTGVVAVIPRRGHITDPRFGATNRKVPVSIVVSPRPTEPAGAMPGDPPSESTVMPVTPVSAGPGLISAIGHKNARTDARADEELEEIDITEVPSGPSKTLVYGGLIAAGLAALYLITRKK